MAKIKVTQNVDGSINKLSTMNVPIIAVKIISVTRKLKIWACDHVPLKRYWRNIMEKCIRDKENLLIIFNFSRNGKGFRVDFWQARWCRNDAHSKFFDRNIVNFEGSRMFPYGVISDWKMKILQPVIEKISVISKLSIRHDDFSKFFSHFQVEFAKQ